MMGYVGKTALMYAVENGDLEFVKYLVEKGANVNAKDKYGETALSYAHLKGFEDIIEY